MAVLPTPVLNSLSLRHSLFLQWVFLMMVVIGSPVCGSVFADNSELPPVFEYIEDEYIEDNDDDDKNVLIDDEDFDDQNILELELELELEEDVPEIPAKSIQPDFSATSITPKKIQIRAPVVKFKVRIKVDEKTKRKKTVIELEENRLQLDEHGKRGILIDASALPASYQGEAILQLSLRYRRHCNINTDSFVDILKDSPSSLASHWVTQESSVKPFSSSQNLYLLQVDLCPQRAGQVFSLSFSKEKNIRSVISKFGSVGFYILASQFAGKFAKARPGKIGPDGDNGGFADTLASALPAGAVFNGIGYFREEVERWNLSGYDSEISLCVTSALLSAALNIGDSKFKSDTSQMFVSNAGRLYSRSAYFGELYGCFKQLIVDPVVYDQWHFSHNVTDSEAEKVSSTTASLLAVLGMYSYDFLNEAELKAMEMNEKQNHPGNNKLELARFGNEVRGGVASSAYKGLDTFHDHIFTPEDTWTGAIERASVNLLFYVMATYILHYSRPYELRQGPKLGEPVLGSRSILAANIMEATTAYAFGQIDKYISKPAAGYLADGLVSLNLTVPDSYLHRGAKVTVRFAINAGVAYKAINLINDAGDSFKKSAFVKQGATKNTRFFVDVITATSTNGVVLPLVLSLDEDVFTPISDGASYFLCSPKGWGVGCPTKELQLGLIVDLSGTLAADTHELKTVISD